jgi:hypothetical protein
LKEEYSSDCSGNAACRTTDKSANQESSHCCEQFPSYFVRKEAERSIDDAASDRANMSISIDGRTQETSSSHNKQQPKRT